MSQHRAFSLIEILVVLVIIGSLSTIGISINRSAKVKARDTERKTDLQTIRTAMVLYKSAQGQYPARSRAWCTSSTVGRAPEANAAWEALNTDLQPYLNMLPLDPHVTRGSDGKCPITHHPWLNRYPKAYEYFSNSPYAHYSIWAGLENERDFDRNGVKAHDEPDPPTPYLGKYSIYSYAYGLIVEPPGGVKPIEVERDKVDQLYAVGCRQVNTTCVDN